MSIFTNMQLRRRMEREARMGLQDPSIPWRLFDEEPEPEQLLAEPEFEEAMLVDMEDA